MFLTIRLDRTLEMMQNDVKTSEFGHRSMDIFYFFIAIPGPANLVRIPAGPLGSLKCDPPKGNGRRPQKKYQDQQTNEVKRKIPPDISSRVGSTLADQRPLSRGQNRPGSTA